MAPDAVASATCSGARRSVLAESENPPDEVILLKPDTHDQDSRAGVAQRLLNSPRMGTRAWIATIFIPLILAAGCGKSDDSDTVAASIHQVLAGKSPAHVSAEAWKDTHEFYTRREHAPAWMMDDQGMQADAAVAVLGRAREHGLDAADYNEQEIILLRSLPLSEDAPEKGTDERARKLAGADVRITAALLTLGRDVALGRTKPERIDSRWKTQRKASDLVGTLIVAADNGLNTWLDTIKPKHAQYAALQKALSDPAMARDADQIAVNLERWRWMPDELGTRYIIVNIPSFHLEAREMGQPPLQMKVVVGKAENKTPIFSDTMTTTVFSPYWNVPDSIVEGETAPAAARDPSFLERNNIEILRLGKSSVTAIDPATVNWDDPEQLKALAFRQKPGAKNALGHVKFLFPNPYEVYLHDTPADALFARAGRAFSHGCVRVEHPEALAKWVLKDSPEWTDEKIREAMNAGEEEHVKLKQDIPIHIVYFTAWADDTGSVRLLPDVYGYDAIQSSH
ncbi:MAG TPA: L,D-transpeptidase family protein [Vicinamibacterales bacterium]|nr:L,D-transpeptidase family protein [Vicinamibacterales bacterium]